MKLLNNLNVGTKLISGFLLVAAIVLAVALLAYQNMKSINDGMTSLFHNRTLPIEQLGKTEAYLYKLRGDLYKYLSMPEDRLKTAESISEDQDFIEEQLALYRASRHSTEEEEQLATFDRFWSVYRQDVLDLIILADSGKEQEALAALRDGTEISNHRKAVAGAIENLVAINVQAADELDQQSDQTFAVSTRIMIVTGVIGMLLAAGLGFVLSKMITGPLKQVTQAAQMIADVDMQTLSAEMNSLAQGDLTRSLIIQAGDLAIHSRDEVGQLASAFNAMIARLQETGYAFRQMTTNLHSLVGEVTQNASGLSSASGQLAEAANQAGQATSQIATTIQQVAKGTSQQSESVSRTATSVEQMSRTMEGVARGAQDQNQAVLKAVEITSQLTSAIQQVSANAQAGVKGSENAAEIAQSGAQIVTNTIQGMETIQFTVNLSAQKVQEMGERSERVGVIVETIEDIASQTNLLALNAAIEAARAGEQGKGFAVVADEVRKLAERASSATKEIGNLIDDIQRTVSDAVLAMKDGAAEVERGVQQANQAGLALQGILSAVQQVNAQVRHIATSAGQMSSLSHELVVATDAVSAVVEQNTAATEEMSAGSSEVTQAIENIASVSEENSAAVEEVSASAEEMTAQVQEVTASAQSLAEMAEALQRLVARFKLFAQGQARDNSQELPARNPILDEVRYIPASQNRNGRIQNV
jgi:methyl-accepting chemotaxis protein